MTGNIKVTSSAFQDGAAIPARHTYQGADVSPELALENVPAGAASLAVICDDPDAPSREKPRAEGPWVHWVLYNLPADAAGLDKDQARGELPSGTLEGLNEIGRASCRERVST